MGGGREVLFYLLYIILPIFSSLLAKSRRSIQINNFGENTLLVYFCSIYYLKFEHLKIQLLIAQFELLK